MMGKTKMTEDNSAKKFVETLVKSSYVHGVFEGLSIARRAVHGAAVMFPQDTPMVEALRMLSSAIQTSSDEVKKDCEKLDTDLNFLRKYDNETVQ